MDKNSSDLQAADFAALPSQDALPQLMLGLCDYLDRRLVAVANYQDLLADELEGKSGLAGYSAKSRDLSLEMHKAVQDVAALLEDTRRVFEPLQLLPLLQGSASKFRKVLLPGFSLEVQVPEGINILGEAFQLQGMLAEMWEMLQHECPGGDWHIQARKIELTQQLRAGLNFSFPDGHYVLLGILRAKVQVEQLLQGQTLLDCLDAKLPLPFSLPQVLRWAGIAASHSGVVLLNQQDFAMGLGLLLPQLPEAQAKSGSTVAWDGAEALGKTILLVDDEDMIWDVISAMLQELGYQVLLAENGQEAVEIYRRNPGQIDLVLLDMIMPTMSGAEAFFLLKTIDPGVKVLLSSGYVSEDEIQEVLNAGAVGFLRKPYRMADLARKIRNILAGD
jgi:CheY-like chemotaxis protein